MNTEGANAAHRFIEAFNKQDHIALAGTLNYPHKRLANGKFWQVDNAEAFAQASEHNEPNLRAEGWDHTTVRSISVVHQGPNKEHIALTIDRHKADGTVYNSFDTFWIATCENEHWGIQFRSSFLR